MCWLKKMRVEKHLLQKDLAKFAGVTPQFYSYIENGNRRPSPQVAKRIAETLGFKDEWYKLLEVTADSA